MEPHQLDNLLSKAQKEAVKRHNAYTTREHVLYVLLEDREIRKVLSDLNIPVDFIQSQLERYFTEILECTSEDETGKNEAGKLTDSVHDMVAQVVMQALSSGRPFPRPADFLISLCGDESSFCAAIFKTVGLKKIDLMRWASDHPVKFDGSAKITIVQQDDIPNFFKNLTKNSGDEDDNAFFFVDHSDEEEDEELEDDDSPEESDDEEDDASPEGPAYKKIKPYVTKLVALARQNKIDPVVGRDKEIETCCRALLRRTKCNVLIVGEAGVGKTAIVEGLALAIAKGNVPNDLYKSEIYSLDIPSLMAGTKFRGEMESRLKSILNYLKRKKDAILFIDELHSAAGTEKGSGAQEILSLIKPELSKGSIRLIGTTTYEDFRKTLSGDSALLRRFHKLDIEEPDEGTAKKIMHEITGRYGEFHNVSYTPEAIDAAVSLASRYLPERRFPDKAIDIIDEAGASNRMKVLSEQSNVIDVPQIEEIVTNIARIPDLHVSVDESNLLSTAEARMKSFVFGQDSAIESVIKLVKLSRAGIRDPQKPVACLLFAGPTGVGKTEVARQLSEVLAMPFVRFDMSEYHEQYTVSKFIGSSPGYVGYERGGLLTEAIRAKPNCVLLLDEIEKAHSSIYDLLLQVMDVARLTDNTGKTADFRNVILVMTSNAGGEEMNRVRIGFGSEIDVSRGMNEIEKTFSPEFRNRLDEIVMFNALTPDTMHQIVTRMVGELENRLKEKNISISLDEASHDWLAKNGYDVRFGARPMARLIQKEISLPLADEILFGKLKKGGKVTVRLKDDKTGVELICNG